LITGLDTKSWEVEEDIDLMFLINLNENKPPSEFALFIAALIYFKVVFSSLFFFFVAFLGNKRTSLILLPLATNMPEPFPEGCVQIVQSLDS
jgi:hypothetical protein